jgi:hypothetical protein
MNRALRTWRIFVTDNSECCLNCERSSDQVPLLRLKFAGSENWICPQCLPILIHKPEKIATLAGDWKAGKVEQDH